ncbi:MAG TPA: RES family NAD+ phosphorylase [Bacteroidia bacterium]|nr:RES family NAD+ phosphorylase [Bacteroidia bacterium]
MILFRLCREIYSRDLTGKGAEKSGGRWNSKGNPMLYTSETRALCLAEMMVNLPINLIPKDFSMVSIFVPDELRIQTLNLEHLPADWNLFPHSRSTQKLGDDFIYEGKFIALRVPSVVVPLEYNVVINPRHPEIDRVKITEVNAFSIDARLLESK